MDNGARSETFEKARVRPGRRVRFSLLGEEDGTIVEELGIGVGYERCRNWFALDGDA